MPMHQLRNRMNNQHNDLTDIIAQALNEIKSELGDRFNLDRINLAELQRRIGISRAKLRHFKENGFVVLPHALIGRKAKTTVLFDYTGIIDALLRKRVKTPTSSLNGFWKTVMRVVKHPWRFTLGNTSTFFHPSARWSLHKAAGDSAAKPIQANATRWIEDSSPLETGNRRRKKVR